MGYQTPNIDRIANKGAMFTDSYAQQSCTAGRASFILGQEPFRTGLLTIGMPAVPAAPAPGATARRRALPRGSTARLSADQTASSTFFIFKMASM
jgi:arylsulfatase A-like enzyme